MPDPKLKEAMEEIAAVLKNYDVGAVVVLSSTTHIQHLLKLNPTWSCIQLDSKGFSISTIDLNSKEEEKRALSVGMLLGLLDACKRTEEKLDEMTKKISQAGFQITHLSVAEK